MAKNLDVLEISIPVFVEKQYDSKHLKYKTKVLGWDEKRFLILNLPSLNSSYLRWEVGTPCFVKFVNKGNVFAFEAHLLKTIFQPKPLMFLSYPTVIENVTLRKYERIQTYIICDIKPFGEEQNSSAKFVIDDDDDIFELEKKEKELSDKGVLLDLSKGGGQIEILSHNHELKVDDVVAIDFSLPTGEPVQNLAIEIKNIRTDEEKTTVGARFLQTNQEAYNQITEFFNKYISKKE